MNRMNGIILYAFIAVFFLSLPASAEFYQYRDESGTLHFTDNLGDVPVEQRAGIKRYHELKPDVPPPPKQAGVEKGVSGRTVPEGVDALQQEKKALDDMYEKLEAEKDALTKNVPKKDAPPDVIATYKRKVDRLNRRIKDYEKKRKAFKEKLDALKAARKTGTK